MAQRFFQGRTNNHLTWAMVDATDFATPESALSAATKIKIYGKLQGATGTNFITSGAGSLTNDITHVGASVLGLYTIALAKADLSDASAAWYDQYVISLSATGAAYQALVVEGVLSGGNMSNLSAIGSDIYSALLVTQSAASDAASAAQQVNSRVLVAQSFLSDIRSQLTLGVPLDASSMSDIRSAITAGPTVTLTDSVMSDIASQVWLHATGAAVASRVLLAKSSLSDIQSALAAGVEIGVSSMSDIRSAIAAGPAATVTASDISDIASAVWANTIGARVDSRVLVNKSTISDTYSLVLLNASMLSDIDSALTSNFSNLLSLVTTTGVQMNASSLSDIRSAITANTATISASDISDIASAVIANATFAAMSSRIALITSTASDAASAAIQANSRVLVVKSAASDIYSMLSDFQSDFQSRVTGTTATTSDLLSQVSQMLTSILSDTLSGVRATASQLLLVKSLTSDVDSALTSRFSDLQSFLTTTGVKIGASDMSDIRSAILTGPAGAVTTSDISDIVSAIVAHATITQINSRLLVNQSVVSDIRSQLTLGVTIGASDMSDIRSAIAAGPAATVTASDISDIASAVWAQAPGAAVSSRVLLAKSSLSDIYSLLSDLQSDFQSRVPKAVATNSQLSDAWSDLLSVAILAKSMLSDIDSAVSSQFSQVNSAVLAITAAALTVSDISDIASRVQTVLASDLSDILSAAQQINSRALVNQSRVSDIDSALTSQYSDVISKVGAIATGAATVSASDISDIASAVRAALVSDLSDILSAAVKANSMLLVNQSRVSDIDSALTSQYSDILSLLGTVGVGVSGISDIASAVRQNLASDISDILSAVQQVNSRVLVNKSGVSDIYSLLSDFQSDFVSRVTAGIATRSQVSDLASDITSRLLVMSSNISDIQSVVGAISFKTNTAVTGFMFKMFDAADHVTPKTGLAITATRSIDGGAFGACANAATEVSAGWYKINLATTDMNGTIIVLKFTAALADATEIEIKTQP